MVIRKSETFPPVTLGHIRSHGCRELLVYSGSINCSHGRYAERRSHAGRHADPAARCPHVLHAVWLSRHRRSPGLVAVNNQNV
jgi:hypothetical protein